MLFVIIPALLFQSHQPKLGETARTAAPEIFRQMQNESAATRKQVDRNALAINAKIEYLIEQIQEIRDDMTKVKAELAMKDTSRVSVLETKVQQMQSDKDDAEKKAKADHDDLMAWVRLIFGAIIAGLIGIGSQILISHRRETRVTSKLEVIKQQTEK